MQVGNEFDLIVISSMLDHPWKIISLPLIFIIHSIYQTQLMLKKTRCSCLQLQRKKVYS